MEVDNNDVETKVVDESVKENDSKPIEEVASTDEVKSTEEVKPAEEVKTAEEAKPVEDVKSESVEVAKEAKEAETAKEVTDEAAKPVETETTNGTEDASPELLEKIKKQVEFYFGDINMHRDKFLIEQTQLDEGWIPMSIMLNFKMLASLSSNPNTILKSIETSELMDISDDKKKIRRKPSKPLPVYDEAYKKAQAARTIYVKGFPLQDVYIHHLKDFFKDFEPFENIIMRRYQDPKDKNKKLKFKGSVFVQFVTLDDAKKFMARESVKYGDQELIRKYSEDYSVEKAKENEERKQKGDSKGKKSSKKENGDSAETEESTELLNLPKGSVLQFTGVSTSTDWDDIKKSLSEIGAEIAYVDFKAGETEGQIRLFGENAAKPILEKMTDNKLKIKDTEVTFRLVEGDEEEEYLKSVQNTMANKKPKSHKGGRRGRPKKGRGGAAAHRGKKRNASPHREAGAAKKVAVAQD